MGADSLVRSTLDRHIRLQRPGRCDRGHVDDVAEILSSGGFYFLGGRFADPTLAGFVPRLIDYFPLTLESTLVWTAVAVLAPRAVVGWPGRAARPGLTDDAGARRHWPAPADYRLAVSPIVIIGLNSESTLMAWSCVAAVTPAQASSSTVIRRPASAAARHVETMQQSVVTPAT